MSVLVRPNRRRAGLAGVLTIGSLVAALATATPVAAVGNGFDPMAAPVVIPGTSTVVDEWKLAGKADPSGVQVAPQWILTAGHAPLGVGGTFTNAYGTATVDQVVTCAGFNSGCDISVSHLSTPIPAPSFPPLLVDGVPASPGQIPAGNTLAVGMGGSTLGRPDAGWTQPSALGLTLTTLQTPPSAIPGDSGGPAFFYHLGATTGVLQGLMTAASSGIVSGLQQFTSARVKPFLDANLPAGTVQWVTYDQLGPRLYVPDSVVNPTVRSTFTSVTLTWPEVTATPAVTAYRAMLVSTDNINDVTMITTGPDIRTAKFTGLTMGVTYCAFILADNANGESPPPYPMDIRQCPTVAAAVGVPIGVQGVTTTSWPNELVISWVPSDSAIPGITHTEVLLMYGAGNPPNQQVADVTTPGTEIGIPLPAGTIAGAFFQLWVRERDTTGKSPWFTTTALYLPQAAPLPPASFTLVPQADGSTAFSVVPALTDPDPNGMVLSPYLPHSQPDDYLVEMWAPGKTYPYLVGLLENGQTSGTFNVSDVGLPPGTYTVQVVAENFTWGDAAPLVASAPLGVVATPPPPPVTTTRTPAAPPQPTDLVVPAVPEGTTITMTWAEPASGPGVATPDEFLIVVPDPVNPAAPPTVDEVPGSQLSALYRVTTLGQYEIYVYALSQQGGASAPVTMTSSGT